jgi:hypothetical protein
MYDDFPAKNTIYSPYIYRVGQNHTFLGIYSVYTVFLAGKSPYIRSYTVCIYGSGQPYICAPIATQLCLQLTIQAEAQSRHLLVPFQKAPHPCTHLLHCIAARNWVEAQPKLAFACTFPTHTHSDTHTQTHSHTHTLTLHCSSPSA